MNRSTILSAVFAAFAIFSAACTQTAITNTNVNVNKPSNLQASDANAGASNASANTIGQPVSVGSLATPADAYRTAYELRKNKDIEGLKKVFSKDVLEFFAMVAEEEKKTLDEALRELAEKPQASSAESRNEKINGDRATIEYLSEKGDWKTMDFVKEGNDWKLTIPKADGPEDDDVKELKKQP